jgi:hypothetical protein
VVDDLDDLESEWSEAYDEILSELYQEATPGLDYDSLDPRSERDTEDEPPLYLQHYLDADTQEEVIEGVLDDYSIPEERYFDAKKAVLLSKGPSASLGNVDRAREDAGLEPVSELLEGGDNQ